MMMIEQESTYVVLATSYFARRREWLVSACVVDIIDPGGKYQVVNFAREEETSIVFVELFLPH
jgi:hypothetical protein